MSTSANGYQLSALHDVSSGAPPDLRPPASSVFLAKFESKLGSWPPFDFGRLSELPRIGMIMFCPASLVKLAWNRASVKRERIRAGLLRTVGCRSLTQMIRDQLQTSPSEDTIRDLHSSA